MLSTRRPSNLCFSSLTYFLIHKLSHRTNHYMQQLTLFFLSFLVIPPSLRSRRCRVRALRSSISSLIASREVQTFSLTRQLNILVPSVSIERFSLWPQEGLPLSLLLLVFGLLSRNLTSSIFFNDDMSVYFQAWICGEWLTQSPMLQYRFSKRT